MLVEQKEAFNEFASDCPEITSQESALREGQRGDISID